jgi:uncharacterized membrane protein YfcA
VIIPDVLGLIGVGVLAGVVSTVVSLASIVSYPALLAFGLPPLSANVTNTVALVFTGVGAAAGSRPELKGEGGRVIRLGWVTALGGATGAALLLVTPSRTFEAIAPWLIAMASLLLLRPRRPQKFSPPLHSSRGPETMTGGLGNEKRWITRLMLFTVAIYIGYFGAAGGVIMLALLTSVLDHSLARVNAIKNVVSALANGVAAVGFALFGPVQWAAAAPLAVGFLLGGWLGPSIARRLPGQTLRIAAAVCGLLVAVKLGVDAYR